MRRGPKRRVVKTVGLQSAGQATDYRLVEFASRRMQSFRNRLAPVQQVPELARRCGATDCYSSMSLLNGDLAEHMGQHEGSVAGYRGPCYAEVLYVDIDAGELTKALTTARQLVGFATDRWGAELD